MNVPFVRQIVGVQGAQQRGFSTAGVAVQHHAFAIVDLQRGILQHRQADAVLLVEHKGFTDVFYADHNRFLGPIAG